MPVCTDYLETSEHRQVLYSFFARVYRVEVDASLWHALQSIEFPGRGGSDDYEAGLAQLQDYLNHCSFTARQDLAVDYAKTFLAAGIAHGGAAFPYESVYTSEDGLVMQDARDEVVSLYREKGLKVEGVVEPEDHLAFELEFFGHLIREGEDAARAGDERALKASIDEQQYFLERHLLNWVPDFCKDVRSYANTGFYQGIASMTSGFLIMDAALLALDDEGCLACEAEPRGRSYERE